MLNLKFQYKNSKGKSVDLSQSEPQYLYLEPFGQVVVRYYIKKDGLQVNSVKMISHVIEEGILSVKIREPSSVYLSRISDFNNVPDRTDPAEYFEIDFSLGDEVVRDVLFTSKVKERLKVKIKDGSSKEESFENENSHTDGPDEYIKVVDVTVKPEYVYHVYIFRRDGWLKKTPTQTRYGDLGSIYTERLFSPNHIDSSLTTSSIDRALIREGFSIDYLEKRIYKQLPGKNLEITDEELGEIIRDHADLRDIINLLTSVDPRVSLHPLIKQAEDIYVSCDSVCSLPAAVPQNSVDERGII